MKYLEIVLVLFSRSSPSLSYYTLHYSSQLAGHTTLRTTAAAVAAAAAAAICRGKSGTGERTRESLQKERVWGRRGRSVICPLGGGQLHERDQWRSRSRLWAAPKTPSAWSTESSPSPSSSMPNWAWEEPRWVPWEGRRGLVQEGEEEGKY